jgi:predicted transcriptional regulator
VRLKKLKILVEPVEQTSERWVPALRSAANEEVLSVSSWEVLGKILSPPRLQILTVIPALKPKSILALAKTMEKDFKNVYSDVKFLADMGLVELREEGRKNTLVPAAKFSGIELALAS